MQLRPVRSSSSANMPSFMAGPPSPHPSGRLEDFLCAHGADHALRRGGRLKGPAVPHHHRMASFVLSLFQQTLRKRLFLPVQLFVLFDDADQTRLRLVHEPVPQKEDRQHTQTVNQKLSAQLSGQFFFSCFFAAAVCCLRLPLSLPPKAKPPIHNR